jgi:hypothetical protein
MKDFVAAVMFFQSTSDAKRLGAERFVDYHAPLEHTLLARSGASLSSLSSAATVF